MKTQLIVTSSWLLWINAQAHYIWSRLLVNGTDSLEFEYVRDVGEDPTYKGSPGGLGKIAPMWDINSLDIICGRGALVTGPKTATADVAAGTEVGFRLSEAYAGAAPPSMVIHPGPRQVYLSPAPKGISLERYRGDGSWFKIDFRGAVNDTTWKLLYARDYNFTIPSSTLPGRYLLRIEQLMPTPWLNYSQWYVNCAHINVISRERDQGAKGPTEFATFPGSDSITDPGILIPEEMEGYPDHARNLTEYQPPGPPVWVG